MKPLIAKIQGLTRGRAEDLLCDLVTPTVWVQVDEPVGTLEWTQRHAANQAADDLEGSPWNQDWQL